MTDRYCKCLYFEWFIANLLAGGSSLVCVKSVSLLLLFHVYRFDLCSPLCGPFSRSARTRPLRKDTFMNHLELTRALPADAFHWIATMEIRPSKLLTKNPWITQYSPLLAVDVRRSSGVPLLKRFERTNDMGSKSFWYMIFFLENLIAISDGLQCWNLVSQFNSLIHDFFHMFLSTFLPGAK